MGKKFHLWQILLCLIYASSLSTGQQCSARDGQKIETIEFSDLNNDFESGGGSTCPWTEESRNDVYWKLEAFETPWDSQYPAPEPLNGRNYLRVDRGSNLSFGVAILHSPNFNLSPDDGDISLSFSFWIRSKWAQFNNLELYLVKDDDHLLLASLFNSSHNNNQEWRTHSTLFSLESPSIDSLFSLVFYAYIGADSEDAVAIDDIQVTAIPKETTDSTSSSTSTERTTTTTTTTTSTSTQTIPVECSQNDVKSSSDETFTCPNNLYATYPDPDDPCNGRYYQCSDCVATLMECQQPQHVYIDQKCCPCSKVEECEKSCKDRRKESIRLFAIEHDAENCDL